jgi:ssDNA-binding Zn-finger/Zn-ribbon topoisomerase 1
MIWILSLVAIVAVALFFLARRSEKGQPAQETFPYQKTEALFSHAERSFYEVLNQAVANNAAIFGKVRMADLVAPRDGLKRGSWQKAFNRIAAEHFDFLLCDKEDLSIICAIELDDGSGPSKRRHERAALLKGVCEAAGVMLIRVPAKSAYIVSEVRGLLPRYLTMKKAADPEAAPAPAASESGEKSKICPNCSALMVKRVARTGKYAGKRFWACKSYPICKTIEPIND